MLSQLFHNSPAEEINQVDLRETGVVVAAENPGGRAVSILIVISNYGPKIYS